MEKGRAKVSVGRVWYMDVQVARGFTPMFIVAAISVIILLATVAWRISHMPQTKPLTIPQNATPLVPLGQTPVPSIATSTQVPQTETSPTDPLSQIGSNVMNRLANDYTGLQQLGIYSSSTAEAAANDALSLMQASVSYHTFVPSDIKTTADTSYARMLAYRADLRTSLAPLLKNTEPEYEIFAYYVQTNDTKYLTQLRSVAQNYYDAASSTAKVVVPADAVSYHVAILNAMEEFGATLDAMVAHANDPFASAALLQAYNQAESDMLTSFNDLTKYYKSKQS